MKNWMSLEAKLIMTSVAVMIMFACIIVAVDPSCRQVSAIGEYCFADVNVVYISSSNLTSCRERPTFRQPSERCVMKRFALLLCLIALMLPATLSAQDEPTRFGFGIALSQDFTIVDADVYNMMLPLNFTNFSFIIRSSNFRIEPNAGLLTYSYTRTSETSTTESSSSDIRLGLSAAYQTVRGPMHYYYGLGVGFIFGSRSSNSSTSESETKSSKQDFFIGPLIGGEYMLHKDFSLGGEIQVNHISVGQWETENDPNPSTSEYTESFISTRVMIILRWYL
jgi:hypothetical protein